MLKQSSYLALVLYTAVALAIVSPFMFQPGYVFALDSVFVDSMPFPIELSASYPYQGLLSIISNFIPAAIIQKCLLLSIIITAGLSMYYLVRYLFAQQSHGAYFAGLLFILNPFTYGRFMTGQWSVLLGYALLPIILLLFIKVVRHPSLKNSIYFAIAFSLLTIFSIHTLGIALLLIVPLAIILGLSRAQGWPEKIQVAKALFISMGTYIIFNSYWIIALLIGKSKTAAIISNFTAADFKAFATLTEPLGEVGTILGLRGFWADGTSLYHLPEHTFSWWLLPTVTLWILVCIGAVEGLKFHRRFTLSLLVSALLTTIFASGIVSGFFSGFNQTLLNIFPFLQGYREPQKFVMALCLIYCIFSAFGVSYIYERLKIFSRKSWIKHIFLIIIYILPLLLAPFMVRGFTQQLASAEYPEDWRSVKTYLQQQKDSNVLFLPWHQYMHFSFAKTVIANPAQAYFGPRTIISADPEFRNAHAQKMSPLQREVQYSILPQAKERDILDKWEKNGIDYVILAKEFDYKKYSFLNKQSKLIKVSETERIILYQVKEGSDEN